MKRVKASGIALIICFVSAKDDSFKAKYSSETVFKKTTLYITITAQTEQLKVYTTARYADAWL